MLYRLYARIEQGNNNNVFLEKNIGVLSNDELLSNEKISMLISFCEKHNIKYRLEYNMFALPNEKVLSIEECIKNIEDNFNQNVNFNNKTFSADELCL